MKSIAFFDVDDTILSGNSGFYTTCRLARHGILKKRRILQGIYYTIANYLFDQNVKKIYQMIMDELAGHTIEELLPVAREILEKDLIKRIYPEAIETLKKHAAEGHAVVYLSSGPYMSLMQIKHYLGIGEVATMLPELKGNVVTNKLNLPICHGKGKIYYAEQMCAKHGAKLKTCYFYSDNHTDIPLLEKVGHPVAVNPSRKLKKYAAKKGWPILKWQQVKK